MTAQIKQIVRHRTTLRAVAEQDYDLAKLQVQEVLRDYCVWNPKHREKLYAAMQRQEEARARFMRALGA